MAKYLVTTVVNLKHQYLVETDSIERVYPIYMEKANPQAAIHWEFIGENICEVRHLKTDEEYNDILDEADEGESADDLVLTEDGMKFGEDDGESDIEDDSDFSSLVHDKKDNKN